MPKYFIDTNQIENDKIKIIGEDVKHISQVLRAKTGDEIFVCDSKTKLNYIVSIEEISKQYILCNIEDTITSYVEPKHEITIFQGLPKFDKMEYIIQKTTELGVKKVLPLEMTRCVVKLDEVSQNKKIDRWRKIALSAAKQSGRDFIPDIETKINVKKLCEIIDDFDVVLVAYEKEEDITLKQELKKLDSNKPLKIGIVIGPEGGIEQSEIETLKQAGAKTITLGKRILRTETASIVILSNIIYEYDI